jgi:hypothetical protein
MMSAEKKSIKERILMTMYEYSVREEYEVRRVWIA